MTQEKPVCNKKYDKDSKYECECHEKMGNDFYFLPFDQCGAIKEETKREAF